MSKRIKVGTRKSQLALIQTNWVIDQLRQLNPDYSFETVGISTTGDKILDIALSKIGEKSLFTKELEISLQNNEVDFVVHSLKDLPTVLPDGLVIAAISKREDPRDAVIFSPKFSTHHTLATLPKGSCIGTSSLRRIAQLKYKFPHLKFIDIRGNLNTRLAKLDADGGPYAAIILAVAGISRMGWQDRIGQRLEWFDCMHAVSQGALGVECSVSNQEVLKLLKPLNDAATYLSCTAERSFLRILEGGCSVPVAVHSTVSEFSPGSVSLHLRGSVWNLDGTKTILHDMSINLTGHVNEEMTVDGGGGGDKESICGFTSVYFRDFPNYHKSASTRCEYLGSTLAQHLLKMGAREILEEVRLSKSVVSS